jgi:hypothetical protein
MMLFFILFVSIIILCTCFYLFRIYKYSFKHKYSTKTMYTFFENHFEYPFLVYWHDVKKSIFREHIAKYNDDNLFVFIEDNEELIQPAGITQAFLHQLNLYHTNKAEYSEVKLKRQLKWIVDNLIVEGDKATIYYHYDTPGHKAPWSSGISQGFAISCLTRAYIFFDDPIYLDLAIKSFNKMQDTVDYGGHRFENEMMPLWYEESNDNSHILNGHLTSLFGVYDLYIVTKDNAYLEVFEKGIVSIKNSIHLFDLGFFTKYDSVSKNTCNNSYHSNHISQFKILHHMTKDVFFEEFALKFQKQFNNPFLKLQHYVYCLKLILLQKLKG